MVGVGVFAYVAAVTQRTSLGVAGIDATERFEVQAALLSTLAVVQLIVYAGLQIPTGVLLDKFGPKILIASGAALMTVGQLTLALARTSPSPSSGACWSALGTRSPLSRCRG